MTAERRAEIEDMSHFELLELIEEIREVAWSDDDDTAPLEDIKTLVGMPEDAELDEF